MSTCPARIAARRMLVGPSCSLFSTAMPCARSSARIMFPSKAPSVSIFDATTTAPSRPCAGEPLKATARISAMAPSECISASQGRRIDDDWLPSGELAHEFDHVLRSARAIARFAIPQRNERSAAQALRQRRVEYPAIAAVVDTDAGRRGPKLFRHDENRAARVLR